MFEMLRRRRRPEAPAYLTEPPGLRIDLGCGARKKEGTLGLDVRPAPGVDHVVNLDTDPLPFADRSVGYVHSSHFLEHAADPLRVFSEIGRVCCDGARLELWTPYGGSNSAFIYDHRNFFVEDHYLHPCVLYPDHWEPLLKGRWILNELQYVLEPGARRDLRRQGMDLEFALRYLRNVVLELCAHITVRHAAPAPPAPPVRRTWSASRYGPREELSPLPAPPG